MEVLGGVFVLKSGLRILIRAPEVPLSVLPKTAKMGVFAYFNTNTPLKPPFRHFGNHFGPPKSDFWSFYFFGHFHIEIPIEAKNLLGRAFQLS